MKFLTINKSCVPLEISPWCRCASGWGTWADLDNEILKLIFKFFIQSCLEYLSRKQANKNRRDFFVAS